MPPVPCPPRPSPPLSAVLEKKAEAKKPLRTRLAEPRRPWATRSNLFLSALLSPRLFFTREGCAFFIAKGWGRACENYRGVPEHETQGNRETKRSLGPENVIERKSGNSARECDPLRIHSVTTSILII